MVVLDMIFMRLQDYDIKAGEEVLIPTGVRFVTDEPVWKANRACLEAA